MCIYTHVHAYIHIVDCPVCLLVLRMLLSLSGRRDLRREGLKEPAAAAAGEVRHGPCDINTNTM